MSLSGIPLHFWAAIGRNSIVILCLLLLASPRAVLAHAGHGDEFHHEENAATQTTDSIQVDTATANRIGIKIESVKRQRLDIGIKTTGKIEPLPSKKVEVTAPIPGKVVELLVEPGALVKKGQTVAVIAAPDLVELRVNSQEKRAEAETDLQKAQADLKLAKENRDRYEQIASAEIAQARTQLAAAQAQYERDRNLVNQKSIIKVAQENYQRQLTIAAAEIAQNQTELAVARERYERDRELVEKGAIPRRQMLESQAGFEAAKAKLAKALTRENVIAAENELKRAEQELPLRELRESQAKLAETQAQLTKALSRREVLEAEAQLKRAASAVEIAQSRLRLSSATYQTRLQQLGTRANDKGLVTVTAPIAGRIADREVTLGQSFEDAGGKLMTIVDDSRVFATANIYEKDLDKVKLGQRVSVKVAAIANRNFTGKIAAIASEVEDATRVVPVKAEIDNFEGVLKPGMFAELEVLTAQTSTAILTIPITAIVEANGKQLVYIQNGDAYQPVEVRLGQTSADLVEVKSGLFEGDLIVTQRATQLYAQSLRGGNSKAKTEVKNTPIQNTNSPMLNLLPGWFWGVVGGSAIATAAFTAGALWSRRRRQYAIVTHISEASPNGVVKAIDANHIMHQESSIKHQTKQ